MLENGREYERPHILYLYIYIQNIIAVMSSQCSLTSTNDACLDRVFKNSLVLVKYKAYTLRGSSTFI